MSGAAQSRDRVLDLLLGEARAPHQRGVTSVCSAHPLVLEAACRDAAGTGNAVLIEATCNQVNQEGGYTGMEPRDFRAFVAGIATAAGLDPARVILGGDHLGPNPWKSLPAADAMAKAELMVAAYVEAGFRKIHLDTSMGCAGEAPALGDDVAAERAARLARAAEAEAVSLGIAPPVYVIGTEVPPPGGATHALETLEPTSAAAVGQTLEAHRAAFSRAGAGAAMDRVIALVVQPGVEFGNSNIVVYDRQRASALGRTLDSMPGLVFEAHSTDYQPAEALAALVDDGFAILKVGPGLTFALREALYGLAAIARELTGGESEEALRPTMERLMLADPRHWQAHYPGSPEQQRLQRHFSYSDRIRYYWAHPDAIGAVDRLFASLAGRRIPETLISQHLARLYPPLAANPDPGPKDLCLAAISLALAPYRAAIGG
jgi:D-tagatose-bisphosphate aldolase class II non-catalytic subunit